MSSKPPQSSVMTEHAAQVYTSAMGKKQSNFTRNPSSSNWGKKSNLQETIWSKYWGGKGEWNKNTLCALTLLQNCNCSRKWMIWKYKNIKASLLQMIKETRHCAAEEDVHHYKKMNTIDLRETEMEKEGQHTGIVKRRPSWETEILAKVLHEAIF